MLQCWCTPWISDSWMGNFLHTEPLDNSSQMGSWEACTVVQSLAQSKASCEVRPGCSRLYPLWSWKPLRFLQSGDCTASLGQLLSCLTVLIMKKFLLISSLKAPNLNLWLLSHPTSMRCWKACLCCLDDLPLCRLYRLMLVPILKAVSCLGWTSPISPASPCRASVPVSSHLDGL